MPRNSFRDPVSNILKAHGFVVANELGDLMQVEADSFALEPGKWMWNGAAWVPYALSPAILDAQKSTLAVNGVDNPQLKAITRALLDEIDALRAAVTPALPVTDRAAFRTRALGYLKALL